MLKTIKAKKKMDAYRLKEKKIKVEYSGLCSTCNNNSTCSFIRDHEKPVLHCEEFDDYIKPITINKNIATTTPLASPVIKKKDIEKFKGLCVNCENRAICKLPKSETGVWHCEEYV
jgi:hypothetical protein